MHLRDRAQKHEHQAEAKKDFSAGFCLYINWLFHFVSSFSFLASLIWVLHRGTAENSARGYAEVLDLFLKRPASGHADYRRSRLTGEATNSDGCRLSICNSFRVEQRKSASLVFAVAHNMP